MYNHTIRDLVTDERLGPSDTVMRVPVHPQPSLFARAVRWAHRGLWALNPFRSQQAPPPPPPPPAENHGLDREFEEVILDRVRTQAWGRHATFEHVADAVAEVPPPYRVPD